MGWSSKLLSGCGFDEEIAKGEYEVRNNKEAIHKLATRINFPKKTRTSEFITTSCSTLGFE